MLQSLEVALWAFYRSESYNVGGDRLYELVFEISFRILTDGPVNGAEVGTDVKRIFSINDSRRNSSRSTRGENLQPIFVRRRLLL